MDDPAPQLDQDQLRYLINHVFLPPKLPQSDDSKPGSDEVLVAAFCSALRRFCELQPEGGANLHSCIRMFERRRRSMFMVEIPEKKIIIRELLGQLVRGEFALFHIRAQNAGLLLTGEQDYILAQAFELRPNSKSVTSCRGRLIRDFPDRAVRIPRGTFEKPDFLGKFVDVVCKLEAGNPVKKFSDESPALVTGFLMGVLAGLGQPVASPKGLVGEVSWLKLTHQVLGRNSDELRERWRKIQLKDAVSLSLTALGGLPFQDSAGKVDNTRRVDAIAACANSESFQLPDDGMAEFIVLELESWIAEHLPAWSRRRLQVKDDLFVTDMGRLYQLALEYHKKASVLYKGVPEALSLMYLTIMEIWVVVDGLACEEVPLVGEYNPGFTPDLFYPLLLPTKPQMERLRRVESYLSGREAAARNGGYLSIYGDFGAPASFAVRYFDSPLGECHQRLRNQILGAARRAKSEKGEEYRRKHQAHVDSGSAEGHLIDTFEWPLPADENLAKAVVFEIKVPEAVAIWRDMTVAVFRDVLRNKKLKKGTEPLFYPTEHPGLRRVSQRTSQVQLASVVDTPLDANGRRRKKITEVTVDEICVHHMYQYDYYDRTVGVHHSKIFEAPRIPATCSYADSVKSSACLQDWVRKTDHTSNQVISEQSRCPKELTLDEFKVFGHFRSGANLQWANVLGQLTIPSLDWNRVSTYALVMQACTEAGPPKAGSELREAHTDLQNKELQRKLVDALEKSFQRICWSWQNINAASLLACVALRILSLATNSEVRRLILQFLSQIRKQSIKWIRTLITRRTGTSSPEERQELDGSILSAALICLLTFDIPFASLPSALCRPRNLRYLVEAAISVHHHMPTKKTLSTPILRHLWYRRGRIVHRSSVVIQTKISEHAELAGLNLGVKRFWDGCPGVSTWTARPGKQGHVLDLLMRVSTVNGDETKRVTWNTLNGQLLIDGLRLRRLPRNFEKSASYLQVFGDKVLEVEPSLTPGFQYSSKLKNGWIVHLSMVNSNVVIQAVLQGTTWELIPASYFSGHLPSSFVKGYTHWKNLTTTHIEFRPAEQPWATSSELWTMKRVADHRVLTRGRDAALYVIDPYSRTAASLYRVLQPIESRENINIIFHQSRHHVVADLPRFSLSFILGEGKSIIKSKQYPEMIIDFKQGLNTLVGLQNKLVLRTPPRPGSKLRPSRMVLVPRGAVMATSDNDHVKVEIQVPRSSHLKHDAFDVNSTLGCLSDKGSLSSKLFLCLLHAFTSHCLPDPFSHRTGTEEALRLLNSAAVMYFERLDDESQHLLYQIARLSPKRSFSGCRAKGDTEMECSVWHPGLPMLSQYDRFWRDVQAIFKHAQDCEILHQKGSSSSMLRAFEKSVPRTAFLVDRAITRNSSFRVSGFGAEEAKTTKGDVEFNSRSSSPEAMVKFTQTHGLTSVIRTGSERLLVKSPESLKTLIEGITGSQFSVSSQLLNLQLDFQYLEPPSRVLAGGLWFQLHRSILSENNQFKKAFFLSFLLQAENANVTLVQTITAASHFSDRGLLPFQHLPGATVGINLCLTRDTLLENIPEIVDGSRLPLEQCPESFLERIPDESDEELSQRCQAEWSAMSDQAVSFATYVSHLSDRMHQVALWVPPEEVEADVPMSNEEPQGLGYIAASELFWETRPAKNTPTPQSGNFVSPKYPGAHEWGLKPPSPELSKAVKDNLDRCHTVAESLWNLCSRPLEPWSTASSICSAAGMYPRLSPIFFLQQLSHCHWRQLPMVIPRDSDGWRRVLINYALSLAYLQRAERLARSYRSYISGQSQQIDLLQDLVNSGGYNGTDAVHPLTNPEALLLEVEQDIPIRPVQHRIAGEMCGNSLGAGTANKVMQLNMGEGKSSVIVPIVAAALANEEQLVRVVVAKPQSKQMIHTLVKALGGLLNRRVIFMPFTRDVILTKAEISVIHNMHTKCMGQGGVLLAQPEHLLSLKLKGLETIYAERTNTNSQSSLLGAEILRVHREFEAISRDIVDESDENLSVKLELIYTMGGQQPIDMSPSRWVVIQELMDTVANVAEELHQSGQTEGLIFKRHAEGRCFPTIRILDERAGNQIIQLLSARLSTAGLKGFPMGIQPRDVQNSVRRYIKYPVVPDPDIARVEDEVTGIFREKGIKKVLLLLRDIVSGGILRFVLGQQRFRVNYGLTQNREPPTMLAVPYRAKDAPSPRSEFSHTDVVIMLTCLSYYYRGLTLDELQICFETLGQSRQAEVEYGKWIAISPGLQAEYRSARAVNLKDRQLCEADILPFLRFGKPTIDFYLANVVFPKEMREFPFKLSSSGWDLARRKNYPLAGFSGTTDSKYVLPLSIQTLDLAEQRHTSASVLRCLLRDGNKVLELGQDQDQLSALTSEMLLDAVTDHRHRIPVILDVGAQIIEHGNYQFAQEWPHRVRNLDIDAVIFFNDQDELLRVWCAVLTLYRVACMRMRKLGQGQTVTFCVSSEMQKRIRDFCSVEINKPIAVSDILTFSVGQTWDETQRSVPLWAIQGIRHQHQEEIWARANETGKLTRKDVQDYLEPEAQSIKQRYPPASGQTLQTLESRLEEASSQHLSRQEELDLEPQTERPPPAAALPHSLHLDVLSFVQTGNLSLSPLNTSAFLSAYRVLKHSSVRTLYPGGTRSFPTNLLVTVDFAWTVETDVSSSFNHGDIFQRPVQWILTKRADYNTARFGMHLVIISQWEAGMIKPILETQYRDGERSGVTMHAYLPRPSNTFMTMENLTTYTVPHRLEQGWAAPLELVMQLNLFAGQLCLRNYDEHVRLCRYLGLRYRGADHVDEDGDVEMGDVGQPQLQPQNAGWTDGFVGGAGGREYASCVFDSSPVPFLRVLYKRIRGDCIDIEGTHMGRILAGDILRREDFPPDAGGDVGEVSDPDTLDGDERWEDLDDGDDVEIVEIM
ncbi:hypothetical protein QBC44DRAFT_400356 [Cladorrhinum sp. PSN332]|nr:hypothetical protein QBC44DRAFT_400356 [Cladorrhinum sp. PSN332]